MYLVNGGSPKTSSSHSCDTVMPPSLRRRDWLAAGVRRPSKNASLIPSGAGCGTARHTLQNLLRALCVTSVLCVRPKAPALASGGMQRKGNGHRERGNFTRFLMIKFISSSFGSNLAQSRNSLLSTNGQNKINYRYAT